MAVVNDDIVKSEILIRAQSLFLQFGLEKTTMEDIAKASGKAKSTLYHHFESKEQLFGEVVSMELWRQRQKVRDKVENHKEMIDKVRAYFLEFNNGITQEVTLSRIISKNFRKKKTAQKYFLDLMNYEKEYLARIIEDGYDSYKCWREVSRENIQEIVELTLASFWAMIDYSIKKDCSLEKERVRQTIDLLVCRLFY